MNPFSAVCCEGSQVNYLVKSVYTGISSKLKPAKSVVKLQIVLNSDDSLFGGFNRLDHTVEFFSSEGWYDDRPRSFLVYAPSRTAAVYALVDDEAEQPPKPDEDEPPKPDEAEQPPEPESM